MPDRKLGELAFSRISEPFSSSPNAEDLLLLLSSKMFLISLSSAVETRGACWEERSGKLIAHCTTDSFLECKFCGMAEFAPRRRGQPGLWSKISPEKREFDLFLRTLTMLQTSSFDSPTPSLDRSSKLDISVYASESPNSDWVSLKLIFSFIFGFGSPPRPEIRKQHQLLSSQGLLNGFLFYDTSTKPGRWLFLHLLNTIFPL